MLIATFNEKTGWAGMSISFESEQFVLEGHGPVAPSAIVEYDEQGHLEWSSDGLRQWVHEQAAATTPSPPPSAESSPAEATQPANSPDSKPTTKASEAPTTAAPATPPKVMPIATFNNATGWVGKTITREGSTYVLQGYGAISAEDIMAYDRDGRLIWASDGTRAWIASLAARTAPPSSAAMPGLPLENQRLAAKKDESVPTILLWFAAAFFLFWVFLPLVVSPAWIFCLFDSERVKKAGFSIKGLVFWAIVLPPVYMYIRLRRTDDSLAPFIFGMIVGVPVTILWCVGMIIGG